MGIFSWLLQREDIKNVTKQARRSPAVRNIAETETINPGLTQGLWHNSYSGLRLAGSLVFVPLSVPVWLMGLPSVRTEDEDWDDILNGLVADNTSLLANLHLQIHRDGAVWVYPYWDTKSKTVKLDIIPDYIVSKVVIDPVTGELNRLEVDELLLMSDGVQANRKRVYTPEQLSVTYTNGLGQSKTIRNRQSIMPVIFANNRDVGEWTGYSDLERILPDLKDYNDIDAARSLMLAKFNAKMVQQVDDVDVWLANNGYDSILDVDISKVDLIFNVGDEKTDFIFPNNATQAYSDALKQKFRKIVEASGIPEIAWGLKTEGNRASVEENMQALVMYVRNKQEQKTDSYRQLFEHIAKIYSVATLRKMPADIAIGWNELSALSAETRAAILEQTAKAVGVLVSNAAVTKEQLYKLWRKLYPDITESELEEFVMGLSDMGGHWQWRNASYIETMDLMGND